MAKHPDLGHGSDLAKPKRLSLGTRLIGFGVVLFVVTRIVVWLPLGFVGSWINGILWPVLVLSILAGAGLLYLKSRRSQGPA